MTPIQHLILEVLRQAEGLSAGEIGKILTLDAATLSGVLDRLAEGEWIEKRTDPEDKRYLRIYMTDKARDILPALVKEREEANESVLGGLTTEERILLRRLLLDIRG